MPANCIIKEQQTLSELADHFQVHRNQISQWKHLLDGTEEIFARKVASENDPSVKELRAKIGRENDFLSAALGSVANYFQFSRSIHLGKDRFHAIEDSVT